MIRESLLKNKAKNRKALSRGKIKLLWVILAAVALIIVCVAGFLVFSLIKPFSARRSDIACNYLTPLALEQFLAAGGEKPKLGEKCEFSSGYSLIKLTYDTAEEAARAKIGLVAGTEGEKKRIDGSDWVVMEGNSSVFSTAQNKIEIFVLFQIAEKDMNMIIYLMKSMRLAFP